ncbi:hypothetical protein Tsubulata_005270 [Turnera subulata]|uniref:DUF4283 domain-containing protein n=1 Tax=Turnera subulata TaxID=218843 RepID=A0A9Q0G1D2_9ROSI|nr:hypothetical protein Tsubulata_005270 [Turnera subulata]
MSPNDSKRPEPPPASPNSPAKDDWMTKKVRLKADGTVIEASPEETMEDSSQKPMEDSSSSTPPSATSYRDKLAAGSYAACDDENWLEEEESDFEEGDVIVKEKADGPSIELSKTFKKRLDKPWQSAVVVKLLGRSIGYKVLQSKLHTMWKTASPYRIIDMENNFFIIRFMSNEDYLHALVDGPWTIFGHALSVQP